MSKGPWVLVTDGGHGGSRDAVAAVRALHAADYLVALTVARGSLLALPSRYAQRRVTVPFVTEPGYATAVRAEASRGPYLTVLPASEAALGALGVSVSHLTDKEGLSEAAGRAGIPAPPSRSFSDKEELLAASSELDYPIVVKPRARQAPALFASRPEEVGSAPLGPGPVLVQPYLTEALRAVAGVMWKGRLVAAVHERWLRIWPPRAGLASAAETAAPDLALEARLIELMEGYDGIFCAQLAGPYLFDLNLRVHSSHPLGVAAGVNLVALYCDLLREAEVPDETLRPRTGAFYRWLEGDVRHLAKSLTSKETTLGSAAISLRPRRHAAHSTESLRDPGPMVSRLLYAASRVHLSEATRKLGARSR
ncbi:MAG: hypothetical protein H0V60_08390 [Actinobacteria bacterium]|nr:hypothetical protein [Actinomycetota bacterium]